ncbi:MAG: hypothetical protein AB8F94_18915 [Saprospiraceae bacterium]
MKTKLIFFKYFSITLLFVLATSSCSQNKNDNSKDQWGNAVWTNLDSELIKFRKPVNLKKSSRYRIKEDLPILALDSNKLFLFQKTLESLEFQDSEIDVFVDTTTAYRVLIICNTSKIDFTKNDASKLKKQMEIQHAEMEKLNPSLEYGPVKGKFNQSQNLKLIKFKTELTHVFNQNKIYSSIYYLTGSAYTLVIYEFSDNTTDIEKYLWTVKT